VFISLHGFEHLPFKQASVFGQSAWIAQSTTVSKTSLGVAKPPGLEVATSTPMGEVLFAKLASVGLVTKMGVLLVEDPGVPMSTISLSGSSGLEVCLGGREGMNNGVFGTSSVLGLEVTGIESVGGLGG
jgi:hypothetical protein